MEHFSNDDGGAVILEMIATIHENVDYLSKVDGAIGDGDHGINMNKGFSICGERLSGKHVSLTEGLGMLGTILLTEIGGSMGPLYGSLFRGMSKAGEGTEQIDSKVFGEMLAGAESKVRNIGNAEAGDKTMMDTLIPAVRAYTGAMEAGKSFTECLDEMSAAAKNGMESTKDMAAKVGRAARLGERSRGVLDAGATSCYLLLDSMKTSILKLLG